MPSNPKLLDPSSTAAFLSRSRFQVPLLSSSPFLLPPPPSVCVYNAVGRRLREPAGLLGINNFLAETGQEEVAWKVLTKLGVNDSTIRTWFNGPALLTWSRGQNEYGGDVSWRPLCSSDQIAAEGRHK